MRSRKLFPFLFFCLVCFNFNSIAQNKYPDISRKGSGIQYIADSLGNKIPDFSYAGYKNSAILIPNVPNRAFVSSISGDATRDIQKAINYVASLQPDKNGIRGAVLLGKGTFNLQGTLYINTSGVILKGSGNSENGTILHGKGVKREAMIRLLGDNNIKITDTLHLKNSHIPLGSLSIQTDRPLNKSDNIFIVKKLNQQWIDSLKMNFFGGDTGWIGWKPGDWDIRWDRKVQAVSNDNTLTLDAPLTMELFPQNQGISILKYEWPGRIENIGVENMLIKSDFHKENSKDEQHRWLGISIENARNSWVRQVNFENLAGGAIHLIKTASQVTVEDCISKHPVSEIAAFRRHTFYTEGQKTLFQRCYSENGYHDFAVGGYGTTGPNAFVQCEAHKPYSFSGTIGSWTTGVLFDIVDIDGDALSLKNQGQLARGSGWTAANSVVWESTASKMEIPSPPTAQNWAFGVWGQYSGDGHWKEVNSHISPRSLFYAQLQKRGLQEKVEPQILEIGSEPSSSPTIEVAAELTEEAEKPLTSLEEWIQKAGERNPISVNNSSSKTLNKISDKYFPTETSFDKLRKIIEVNAKLTFMDSLLTGKPMNVMWWRGSLRDDDLSKATPHVTRFVPGRRGRGLTDNLEETVAYMKDHDIVSLNHNYGLWYDRRMDDHQRVRRFDTDTWPPFYEQPFNRSGKDTAWDHLSKYDLTSYNTWYWSRLQRFAKLAEQKGLILRNEQYFQHNIIEAGAHWASTPWRSANNINDMGFPEPPPYAGDKRIFMSKQFYDVTNPTRRKIHEAFIRKSLENFKDESNVIQLTSEEFTGPLHFMQFWVDVIKDWEKTNQNKALIGLSATKDVQDAILADPERRDVIDVIDIKYWYYRKNGEVYAPEGGKHLAPRQHARKMETGSESSGSVYRSIREYKEKFPDKIVVYSTNAAPRFGWAELMAGASLPVIPKISLKSFYTALPKMHLVSGEDYKSDKWTLENEGQTYLFYLNENQEIKLNLSSFKGKFQLYNIDPESGNASKLKILNAGSMVSFTPKQSERIIFIEKLN